MERAAAMKHFAFQKQARFALCFDSFLLSATREMQTFFSYPVPVQDFQCQGRNFIAAAHGGHRTAQVSDGGGQTLSAEASGGYGHAGRAQGQLFL
jgi:hypothetical protein